MPENGKDFEVEVMKSVNFGDDIPEWLLTEVLIRLPVKFVFKSKLVSKQWLSLISDPSFARMYVSRALISPHSQTWTYISSYMRVKDSQSRGFPDHELLVEDIHTSSSSGYKRPGVLVLTSPSTEHYQHGTHFTIVGVSNGLILCGKHIGPLRHFDQYVICNPITGQWITLPPHSRHFGKIGGVSTGFLTRVENNVLTSYRVVRLGLDGFKMTGLDVFIFETGEWKEFNVCINQTVPEFSWRAPTDFNGVLHWVDIDCGLIAYDPYHNLDCLSSIPSPADPNQPFPYGDIPTLLDVHQGRLRCVISYANYREEFSTFDVWLLNDYSTGDWHLQHRVNLQDISNHKILHSPHLPTPISFHPFNSDILYLGCCKHQISYNIKTRKIEDRIGSLYIEDYATTKLHTWSSTFVFMVPPWPINISLPSFGVVES